MRPASLRESALCRQHERPKSKPAALRIYEAHVGMSSEAPEVASYTYFKGGEPLLSLVCSNTTRYRSDTMRSFK